MSDLKSQPIFEIKKLEEQGDKWIFKMWFPPPGTGHCGEWVFEKMTLKRLKRRIEIAIGKDTIKDILR